MTDPSNPLNLDQETLGKVVLAVHVANTIETVTDHESSEKARETRSMLKDVETRIERARVAAKAPFLQEAKNIDSLAKVIFDQVKPQIARLDRLRLEYSNAYKNPPAPVVPDAAVSAEFGAVPDLTFLQTAPAAEPPKIRTRTYSDIQILDESRIPDEFWVLDTAAVRRAVLHDRRDVPGVIIIEKTSVLE